MGKVDKGILQNTKEKQLRAFLILEAMVLVTCIVCFSKYLFGDATFVFRDIGSDTMEQYINQYSSIVNHIRTGNFSLWDFNNGLGASMFTLNMFNPFLILVYILGAIFGTTIIPHAMIYIYMIEILFAAGICYFYLNRFALGESGKIIAAYVYAFNGFMIVWGQHYQFGVVVVLFPLLLLMIERFISNRRKWVALTLVTALCVMNSMYMSYMMLLAGGFYTLIRFIQIEDFKLKKYLLHVSQVAASMLLGVGIAAVNLFPSILHISNVTSRLGNDTSLAERVINGFAPYPAHYYKVLLYKSIFAAPEQIIDGYTPYLNLYEDPNIWFTSIFILLVIGYVICITKYSSSKKERVIQYIVIGLIGLSLCVPAISLMFNGFTAPFSRHTFLLMPFFAIMLAKMVHFLFHVFKRYLVNKKVKVAVLIGLIVFFMGDVIGNTSMGNHNRVTLDKNDSTYLENLYSKDYLDAFAYLKEIDHTFYRIEKLKTATLCMDAMIQNYSSVSTYNSTLNKNVYDMVSKIYPALRFADVNHYSFAQVPNAYVEPTLLGVKYLIGEKGQQISGFNPIKEFGELAIYKNNIDTNVGLYFESVISESEYEAYEKSLGNELLFHNAIIPDDKLKLAKEAKVQIETSENTFNAVVKLKEQGQIVQFKNGGTVTLYEPSKDHRITGQATLNKQGFLMFSIPYEEGWYIYINGKRQEMIKTNYGLMGTFVDSGENEIRIVYNCPGFTSGLCISIVSLLLLGMTIWFIKGRRTFDKCK